MLLHQLHNVEWKRSFSERDWIQIDCCLTNSDFKCAGSKALLKVDQSMTLKLSANQPILKKLGTSSSNTYCRASKAHLHIRTADRCRSVSQIVQLNWRAARNFTGRPIFSTQSFKSSSKVLFIGREGFPRLSRCCWWLVSSSDLAGFRKVPSRWKVLEQSIQGQRASCNKHKPKDEHDKTVSASTLIDFSD
jgi:hypothetical protein